MPAGDQGESALHIAWRGPLASCNYDCGYCPFAKHQSSRDELRTDAAALERFVEWIRTDGPGDREVTISFTPWGEALIRRWYREAIVALSHLPKVGKVAIQTNLTAPLRWLTSVNRARVGLWVTYHPSQVDRGHFIARCRELDAMGVGYSVGIVGLRENLAEARWLREALDDGVYLWVNAYKSEGQDYYAPSEFRALAAIDQLFPVNALRHPSLGRACRTGQDAIMIDGRGDVRRCHFVSEVLGNIYRDPLGDMLRTRACPSMSCGCHIGYVHMPGLGLREVFGDGLPERIPKAWPSPP